MARKEADGTKHKKSDKARERYEKNGKFSTKHIRIIDSIRSRVNTKQVTGKK